MKIIVVHLTDAEYLAGVVTDETAALLARPDLWLALDEDDPPIDLPDGFVVLEPAWLVMRDHPMASPLNPREAQLVTIPRIVKQGRPEAHVFFGHCKGRPTVLDADAPDLIAQAVRAQNASYFPDERKAIELLGHRGRRDNQAA